MKLMFWRPQQVPVLRLHGLIASRADALNIDSVKPALLKACAAAAGATLVLDIDSPGGSPVQSDLIGRAILHEAERKRVRVVAVIGEAGASGGYWLACAATTIRANPMSIVGSIGVRGGGFGLSDLLARYGVERRLYTAGGNKARLDPFSPEKPEDRAFIQTLLDDVHTQFKEWVRTRRGDRLADDPKVFDGSFFLGQEGMALGLVDALGDLDTVVRELGGEKATAQVFRPRRRRSVVARLTGAAVRSVLEG